MHIDCLKGHLIDAYASVDCDQPASNQGVNVAEYSEQLQRCGQVQLFDFRRNVVRLFLEELAKLFARQVVGRVDWKLCLSDPSVTVKII